MSIKWPLNDQGKSFDYPHNSEYHNYSKLSWLQCQYTEHSADTQYTYTLFILVGKNIFSIFLQN